MDDKRLNELFNRLLRVRRRYLPVMAGIEQSAGHYLPGQLPISPRKSRKTIDAISFPVVYSLHLKSKFLSLPLIPIPQLQRIGRYGKRVSPTGRW